MLISGMYIELFLLDNVVMDMLILRMAAALRSRPAPVWRVLAASLLGAAYAALGVVKPALMAWPWKLAAGMLMALSIKCGGVKDYFYNALAVLLAAFLAGGGAFFLLCLGREGFRLGLYSAFFAACLPRLLGWLLARRGRGKTMLRVVHGGVCRDIPALIDSGNMLTEPLSAKPVVVAYIPELAALAHIPIPARTPNGTSILYALKPDVISAQGQCLDVLLALAPEPTPALIPPNILQEGIWEKSSTDL